SAIDGRTVLEDNYHLLPIIPVSVPSVLSPKYEVFCRRSVGCFSRRERSAHIFVIRVERATRKNSPLAPAQRVAMKMGRRLRCSSVTYRFRYAPSSASPARTALPAAHFDRNKIPRISGTGHLCSPGPAPLRSAQMNYKTRTEGMRE